MSEQLESVTVYEIHNRFCGEQGHLCQAHKLINERQANELCSVEAPAPAQPTGEGLTTQVILDRQEKAGCYTDTVSRSTHATENQSTKMTEAAQSTTVVHVPTEQEIAAHWFGDDSDQGRCVNAIREYVEVLREQSQAVQSKVEKGENVNIYPSECNDDQNVTTSFAKAQAAQSTGTYANMGIEQARWILRSNAALIAKIQKSVHEHFAAKGEPNERWSDYDVLDQGVAQMSPAAQPVAEPSADTERRAASFLSTKYGELFGEESLIRSKTEKIAPRILLQWLIEFATLPPSSSGLSVEEIASAKTNRLYYAQKDGCFKHEGSGRICYGCVELGMIEAITEALSQQAGRAVASPGAEEIARQIVADVSEHAIKLAIVRNSLVADDDEELDEAEIVSDAVACLVGDDTGCLDPDDPQVTATLDKITKAIRDYTASLEARLGRAEQTAVRGDSLSLLLREVGETQTKLRESLENVMVYVQHLPDCTAKITGQCLCGMVPEKKAAKAALLARLSSYIK